jgi:hypothetical protein
MIGVWNPPSSRPNPSYHFQGWNGKMGGVSTSYIMSTYPFPTMFFLSNYFLMENPPPIYVLTLGGNVYPHMGNPLHGFPSSRGNVYPHMGNPYHTSFSLHAVP